MEHTLTFNEHAMRITLDKNKDIIDRILRSKNAEGTVFSSEIMPINDIMEQCNFDADTWCNIGYFLRYMAKRCTDTMVYASDALMFDSAHTMDEIEHVKLGIAGDEDPTEIDVDVPTLFKIMLSVIYGGAAICDTAFDKTVIAGIYKMAYHYLDKKVFQRNTATLRTNIQSDLQAQLDMITKSNPAGLYSGAVICDDTNNADMIGKNELQVDFRIKPTKTSRWITLTIKVESTGTSNTQTTSLKERKNDLMEAASTVRKTKPKAKAKSKHMIKSTKEK